MVNILICYIFYFLVGWGKNSITQSSHNQSPYGVNYDQNGEVSVKHQLINLISATRTLMRSKQTNILNTIVIILFIVPLVLINIIVILFLIVLG